MNSKNMMDLVSSSARLKVEKEDKKMSIEMKGNAIVVLGLIIQAIESLIAGLPEEARDAAIDTLQDKIKELKGDN